MNLERTPTTVVDYPRWLRGWCALTAMATFGLIAIGTLVTTFGVGMADTVWPTPPWRLLFLDRASDFGLYVEHSHRTAGYLVGVLILVQTLSVWFWAPGGRRLGAYLALLAVALGTGWGMYLVKTAPAKSLEALANPGFYLASAGAIGFVLLTISELMSGVAGRWHRALVTVAYVGVVVQGMLGGLRVYLNELRGPELAVIHGLFAQVVFASVCLLALMASRRWNSLTDLVTELPLRKLTAALLVLLIVQVVFGGLLRHFNEPMAQRLHPLLGIGVVGLTVWIVARTRLDGDGTLALRRKAIGLMMTVAVQVVLGVEAWLRVGRAEIITPSDATMRTLHVLVGFGVVSTATLLAARAWKGRLI